MKFRQMLKKQKQKNSAKKEQKKLLLLNEALNKLVEYNIASTVDNKYQYSEKFKQTIQQIISSPPSKLEQIKLGRQASHKLIPQILGMATSKTSRRDIENIVVAYVCLKTHIEEENFIVDKKLLPDLTYAVWYLNDHNPTTQEVEEWNLTSQ
jgi:hypothetical protein